jgi:hypothetical protein
VPELRCNAIDKYHKITAHRFNAKILSLNHCRGGLSGDRKKTKKEPSFCATGAIFTACQTAVTIHRSSVNVTSLTCQRHLHWLLIYVSVVDFQMGVISHLSDLLHLGDLWQASTRSMNTSSSWKIKTGKAIEVLAYFACFVCFVSIVRYFDDSK